MKIEMMLDPSKYEEDDYEKHEWLQDFVDYDYKKSNWFHNLKPKVFLQPVKDSTVRSCPAFVNGFRNRIVIRNLANFHVSNVNGKINFYSEHPYGPEYHYTFHSDKQLGEFFPTPPKKLTNPVKFMSPYWFIFSETVDVFFSPLWWQKESEVIEAIPGVIRIEKNEPLGMNVNCFVKTPSLNTQYAVEKNYPLCQLFVTEVKKPKLYFVKSVNKRLVNKAINNSKRVIASGFKGNMKRYLIK